MVVEDHAHFGAFARRHAFVGIALSESLGDGRGAPGCLVEPAVDRDVPHRSHGAGARRLGMRAVLTHEFRQEEPDEITPDAIIERLTELPESVDRLALEARDSA